MCQMPTLDARSFITALRGRFLEFVGDSVTLNMFQALVCMLASAEGALIHKLQSDGVIGAPCLRNASSCVVHLSDNAGTLSFARSNFLVAEEAGALELDHVDAVVARAASRADVLLLATGHHYRMIFGYVPNHPHPACTKLRNESRCVPLVSKYGEPQNASDAVALGLRAVRKHLEARHFAGVLVWRTLSQQHAAWHGPHGSVQGPRHACGGRLDGNNQLPWISHGPLIDYFGLVIEESAPVADQVM